jgi:kynurenine formamidase
MTFLRNAWYVAVWDDEVAAGALFHRRILDPSIIWEGHKAGREIGYCHLESLHNLEALPGDGFKIARFPVKIRGASAGWTRAVAIVDSQGG